MPHPQQPCVLFAGGGTGGHLFPGIAVAEVLRKRHPTWHIAFVGTVRGIEYAQVPRYRFALHVLPVEGLRGRNLPAMARSAGKLPLALGAALQLIYRLRPRVAVSVGGYAAGPAVLAARLAGVPCVVMEQNAFAGVTNRLLAKFAKHVLLALPNQQLGGRANAQVLGNPVRASLRETSEVSAAPLPPAFSPARRLRVLAFGGSQGARAMNDALLAFAPTMAEHAWPLTLLHQTGTVDCSRVAAGYAAAGLRPEQARAVPFVDDMASAMGQADLLICRAGASTLAEAAVMGRAAWLVPYPHAADDHQWVNAQVFVRAGAARSVAERDFTASWLKEAVSQTLAAPATLGHMAERAKTLARPRAAEDIADVIANEVLPHVS